MSLDNILKIFELTRGMDYYIRQRAIEIYALAAQDFILIVKEKHLEGDNFKYALHHVKDYQMKKVQEYIDSIRK